MRTETGVVIDYRPKSRSEKNDRFDSVLVVDVAQLEHTVIVQFSDGVLSQYLNMR